MVGQLTYGKRQWESLDAEMRRLIPIFDKASKEMTTFVDADTNAFNDYMLAMKMSKNTEGLHSETTLTNVFFIPYFCLLVFGILITLVA